MVEMLYRVGAMPRKQRGPNPRFHARLNVEVKPEDELLIRQAKADAVLRDQPFREWVMEALKQKLEATDAR
jgi:hypothetical protein